MAPDWRLPRRWKGEKAERGEGRLRFAPAPAQCSAEEAEGGEERSRGEAAWGESSGGDLEMGKALPAVSTSAARWLCCHHPLVRSGGTEPWQLSEGTSDKEKVEKTTGEDEENGHGGQMDGSGGTRAVCTAAAMQWDGRGGSCCPHGTKQGSEPGWARGKASLTLHGATVLLTSSPAEEQRVHKETEMERTVPCMGAGG